MSHIVTLKSCVTNLAALQAACRRLGLVVPELPSSVKIFGNHQTGHAVRLKGWNYPVVFQGVGGPQESAQVKLDNYNGSWGDINEYYNLIDVYNQENARLCLQEQGVAYTETVEDGNVVFITEGE